jgi:hypothetical protein
MNVLVGAALGGSPHVPRRQRGRELPDAEDFATLMIQRGSLPPAVGRTVSSPTQMDDRGLNGTGLPAESLQWNRPEVIRPGGRSSGMLPSSEQRLPEELKESEVAVGDSAQEYHGPQLVELVPNDRSLYEAMEFFLLINPREQISSLGDFATVKRTADEARSAGDDLQARINYETAAKIALYNQNRKLFVSMLTLADGVTPTDQDFAAFHRTLLTKTDEAMRVARDFYAELERESRAVAPRTPVLQRGPV